MPEVQWLSALANSVQNPTESKSDDDKKPSSNASKSQSKHVWRREESMKLEIIHFGVGGQPEFAAKHVFMVSLACLIGFK